LWIIKHDNYGVAWGKILPRQEGLGCTTPEPIDILSKGNIVFVLKRVVMAYLNQIAYNFDSSINTEHDRNFFKRKMKHLIFVVDFFTKAIASVGSMEATPLTTIGSCSQ
jgi:hypothetical protein